MRRTSAPLMTAYGALAAADTALAASGTPAARRWRRLTKPLLMPTLMTGFATATTPAADRAVRNGALAALGLSGAGDTALLRRDDRAFLLGLSSFFAAHLAYLATFARLGRPLADRSAWGGPAAAAGVWAATGPALASAAGRRNPALQVPVLAYTGVLSAMAAASTRLRPDLPPAARRTIVTGTGLFLVSDGILGMRNFVLPERTPATDALVMLTYTAAQGCIAKGLASAQHAERRQRPGLRPAH